MNIRQMINKYIFDTFIKQRIYLISGQDPVSRTPFFEIHLSGQPVKRIDYAEIEALFNRHL